MVCERWCVTKMVCDTRAAKSATPATQNERGCRHMCHAKRRWMSPSATPATQSAAASPATNAVQARHTKADVTKCHACHAKRWMSPSATPATQSAAASPATNSPSAPPEPAQCHKCHPRLQRETKADVTKCHACHAKPRWMSPSATPATHSAAASPATNAVQARHQSQASAIRAGGCHQVPHLPRETKVDVAKCHACHAKCRGVTGDQCSPSAPPEPAKVDVTKCHAKCRERWCVRKMCVRDGERWWLTKMVDKDDV